MPQMLKKSEDSDMHLNDSLTFNAMFTQTGRLEYKPHLATPGHPSNFMLRISDFANHWEEYSVYLSSGIKYILL